MNYRPRKVSKRKAQVMFLEAAFVSLSLGEVQEAYLRNAGRTPASTPLVTLSYPNHPQSAHKPRRHKGFFLPKREGALA